MLIIVIICVIKFGKWI